MKKKPVKQAVGSVLIHDITEVIPGTSKGRAFKKGHIIQKEDIPRLLSLGKEHIYVWDGESDCLHENEAAARLAAVVGGSGICSGEISEGRIDLYAAHKGLLKIDRDLLYHLNLMPEIIIATRQDNLPVEKGQPIAGTRIIPLVIEEEKIITAEKMAVGRSVAEISPLKELGVGLVTTGSEVYTGRIDDGFEPVVRAKIDGYGLSLSDSRIVPDDEHQIAEAIRELITDGTELVICTGGMSVDPDDLTPEGIRRAGAETMVYGAPVLPGAMVLVAYRDNIPIIGVPACALHAKTTVFDLILPRILAGEQITEKDLAAYGHGGLCAGCSTCRYPDCGFGKGGL